jgi:hypothetical protein
VEVVEGKEGVRMCTRRVGGSARVVTKILSLTGEPDPANYGHIGSVQINIFSMNKNF